MRKVKMMILAGCLLGVAATLAAGLALRSSAAPQVSLTEETASAGQLPLTHVHLFTNGVGYFQREGVIEGNARINLTFSVHNLNDLLKSLVLQDLDGGRISVVGYDSHDPGDKALGGFAINLHNNPTYAQILGQARGEKVEVGMATGTLAGSIIGVEKRRQAVGSGKDKEVVESDVLNLMCADGMRSVKLSEVTRIRFLNPVVDRDFKLALEVLARSHDAQKKTVTLEFVGQGKRRVRVGYVVESPLWKTSYRLVTDKNGKPTLQGWAIIDNPTNEDWKDVRLALVAGRPLSYQMDLYTPLYVPRPRVELELFAGLRPRTHDGAMDWMELQRKTMEKVAPRPSSERDEQPRVKAEAVGEFFQYVLEHPISLARNRSAMVPILNEQVGGEPVSVYAESTLAKHPLRGMRFKNTTKLYLMQGPITLFSEGTYAGEAVLPNLHPGEERLITSAIDLGMEVAPRVATPGGEQIFSVRIAKGVLYATLTQRESKTYHVRNRTADQDRVLLIEHPIREGLKLIGPAKPTERARGVYRFEVKVPAGKAAELEVIEERTIVQQVTLTNADDKTVLTYLSSAAASPAVREALKKAQELKGKLTTTQRAIARAERQLKSIVDDQARLRANMARVPKDSDAYKRYLKKFEDQETEIEKLQDEEKKLQTTAADQRLAYEEFLANLDVK